MNDVLVSAITLQHQTFLNIRIFTNVIFGNLCYFYEKALAVFGKSMEPFHGAGDVHKAYKRDAKLGIAGAKWQKTFMRWKRFSTRWRALYRCVFRTRGFFLHLNRQASTYVKSSSITLR